MRMDRSPSAGVRHGFRGLVARQDDHVAVVARVQRQVVQHTAARGHAAGCQDDHGAMQARQAFGLFWGLHHRRAMLQRVHFPALRRCSPRWCWYSPVVLTAMGLSRNTLSEAGITPCALR